MFTTGPLCGAGLFSPTIPADSSVIALDLVSTCSVEEHLMIWFRSNFLTAFLLGLKLKSWFPDIHTSFQLQFLLKLNETLADWLPFYEFLVWSHCTCQCPYLSPKEFTLLKVNHYALTYAFKDIVYLITSLVSSRQGTMSPCISLSWMPCHNIRALVVQFFTLK